MADVGSIYNQTSDWQAARWHDLELLFERSELPRDDVRTILDLGCGSGTRTRALLGLFSNTDRVIAIDSSLAMVNVARKENQDPRIEYLHCPIESLGWLDIPLVDCIAANYVLHWLQDKDRLFSVLEGKAKSHARLLIGTCERLPDILQVIDEAVRAEIGNCHDFPFFYLGGPEWRSLLERWGWNVRVCHRSSDLHCVSSGLDYLTHWYSASAGKAFYGKGLSEFSELFIEDLLNALNNRFGRQGGGWSFSEETLLLIAERH